jgi:hypothetical protein
MIVNKKTSRCEFGGKVEGEGEEGVCCEGRVSRMDGTSFVNVGSSSKGVRYRYRVCNDRFE